MSAADVKTGSPLVAPTSSYSLLKPTPLEEIPQMVADMRAHFLTQTTKTEEWRRTQLTRFLALVNEHGDELLEAVYKDLKKNKNETNLMELLLIKNEIADHLNHLSEWMAPQKVSVALVNAMDGCQIRAEPLGTVLIIGAWNYPIQLTLLPLVGAITAGNCALIKPSELSEHTAALIAKLIPQYMDNSAFKVVNGAVAETTAVLREKWDKILYTGNGVVGRIVLEAAAKHLTPVLLELGGKSPVVVDRDVDLKVAARRIAWGKWTNCGQTCIAPDYVMCEKSVQPLLVKELQVAVNDFFSADPKTCVDYGRIINARHFNRLKRLLTSGGDAAIGGEKTADEADRYIPPTVLTDVDEKSAIMREEIFGPILPIMTVDSVEQAISYINKNDKPLALYVFSNNKAVCEQVLKSTSSGGAIANDTLMHAAIKTLPFGGVGPSGTGAYHGKFSFDAWSHQKAVMVKQLSLEAVNGIRYPPYTDKKGQIINALMGVKPHGPYHGVRSFLFKAAVVAGVLAIALRYSPWKFGK